MISFDFEYYRPASIQEAIELFQRLEGEGKQPIYYSGGTEIITLGRLDLVVTKAVIDIKGIPECRVLQYEEDYLALGGGLSLTEIEEANLFPLLSKTASEVADHTARNKITVGGNICGQIFYREAVLPFLLTDSQVITAGLNGLRTEPINTVFNQHLQLEKGEFLVLLLTEKDYLDMPHISIKIRQQWDTGYPLATIAAIKKEEQVRVAFSGVCPFPFRSKEIEEELNNKQLSLDERVNRAIRLLPEPILDDVEGSAEYRKFVIKTTLVDIITGLEGDEHAII
ncbi:FAD binding domain-containing protein [Bacillus songklensis]|uniref:FAD binding domain-containing protein n=1 Tax=Bacillus songklensis TaxID=1069116 RepID=A0ABV8B618_9BACI